MRVSTLALLLSSAVAGWAQNTETDSKNKGTTFNSQPVPPFLELTATTWDDEMKKSKYMVVKHYSPQCHHCIDFAPTYQTLYEFYHTSKPAAEAAVDSTFTKYYDLRFAAISCLAFGDLCEDKGITSWPSTLLYENGKVVDQVLGGKNMTVLSNMIEATLEKAKPGSRPRSLDLPAPGDKEAPKSAPKKNDELATEDKPGKTSAENNKSDKSSADKSKSEEKSDEKSEKSDKYIAPPVPEQPKEKTKVPATKPNVEGVSVPLTAETFQRLVTMSQDPWFIKFYAPWCPHCQDMAPTWEQVAKNMRGKLNIGEVNCDRETRLCKDVRARAFPTILFFKGGERAEYQGLRGLGDFVQYADKALDLAGGVPDVDAESFKALELKEEVIFVYFYDHATTSEDFRALERIPLSLIGHAKLVKTKDPKMSERFKITTWPRLLVSREGRPTYYPPLTPNAMRDTHQVLDWMKSVWLPLVPELTVTNARQIMDRKIVVLGILNREDQDGFQGALREMKSAANEWMDRQIQEFQLERKKLRDAKQMRIEEAEDRDDQRALRSAKAIRIDMNSAGRKEVGFAWVDSVAWQRWIRTTYGLDAKDGERVIINDEDSRKYWDTTVTGNYILVSRTSIMETLDKVVYNPQTLKHKLTVSSFEKIFYDIRVTLTEHPFLSFGCIAGLAFGAFSWMRGKPRRARGHFRLEDSISIRDFKDGLLGGNNGNTKAD